MEAKPAPDRLADAEAVLYLEIDVEDPNRERFLDFCRRAFPVYESVGGTRMALYEHEVRPGRFVEVGYYRSLEDYRRSEAALEQDPRQAALLKEWRGLLKEAPRVALFKRVTI